MSDARLVAVASILVARVALAVDVIAEPDAFPADSDLTGAIPSVIATVVDGGPGEFVGSAPSAFATTGAFTFQRDTFGGGPAAFVTGTPGNPSATFRALLQIPADAIAVDLINVTEFARIMYPGTLRATAFNAGGAVLDTVDTAELAFGTAERVTLSGPGIASLEVVGIPPADPPATQLGVAFELDDLVVTIPPFDPVDCNADGEPDLCQIADGELPDCNSNGVPDFCDLAYGGAADGNFDGVPDRCVCGCIDLAIALDTTASRGAVIDRVKQEVEAFIDLARFRAQDDLRMAYVRFVNAVLVDEELTFDVDAVEAAIEATELTGNPGSPEASDQALREIITMDSACVESPQQFTTPFRRECEKYVALITDTAPAGCDDAYVPGVDDVEAHTIALAAAAAGIEIHAILVPNGTSPPDLVQAAEAIMMDYATTTGGRYTRTAAAGNGVAAGLVAIVNGCADCNGNGIPDAGDIDAGTSLDVNGNGVPDECDEAAGLFDDCNGNGRPDGCDLADGLSVDVDGNGLPDECDAAILHVDPAALGPRHDGVTWDTAYADLQDALVVASNPDNATADIWAAAATYLPDRGSGNRLMSFTVPSDIVLRGGFLGTADPGGGETDPAQADPEANPTILSGDIGVVGDDADNTRQVVEVDDGVTVDGFRINDGNADNGPDAAGLTGIGGAATISRCRFTGNRGSEGGGALSVRAGTYTVSDCVFESNVGAFGGGVLVLASTASVSLIRCAFDDNAATADGGGVSVFGGALTASDCTFAGNAAGSAGSGAGGGVWITAGATASLTGSTFDGNTSGFAGAACGVAGASTLALDNCTLTQNQSANAGGGGWITGGASAALSDCVLDGNVTAFNGGALDVNGASLVIQDCQFVQNDAAAGAGGGLWLTGGTTATVSGSTFEGNTCGFAGAAFGIDTDAAGALDGCTFTLNQSGNAAGAGWVNGGATATITAGTFDRNAAAFNGGALDVNGGELVLTASVFTDNVSTGGNGGAVNLVNDATAAISDTTFDGSTAGFGGAIIVDTALTVEIDDCAFTGNGADTSGGAIFCAPGSAPMIRMTQFSSNAADFGGAIFNNGASTSLLGCTFTGNAAAACCGGAINNLGGTPRISGCAFTGNSSLQGGAVFNQGGAAGPIVNCTFHANTAAAGGGAIMLTGASAAISHTRITGSSATDGGAIEVLDATLVLDNALLAHNTAANEGGAIRNLGTSDTTITSTTFVGNQAAGGGAIANDDGGGGAAAVTVVNAILRDGSPTEITTTGAGATTSVAFSNVQGGFPGPGNIDADPLFVDPLGVDGLPGTGDEDLRLAAGSPSIDAGDGLALAADFNDVDDDGVADEPVPADVDGRHRTLDDPNTVDTGNGPPPVVDMGAYEHRSCPVDATGDGMVGFDDVLAVLTSWGPCPWPCPPDLDGDGVVDFQDLLTVLTGWANCP